MKVTSAILCDHANEVPAECHCPKNCYCKKHTCKNRSKVSKEDQKLTEEIAMSTPSCVHIARKPESKIITMVKEELKHIKDVKKKHPFDSKAAKKIWNKSDDAIRSTRMLSQIYPNVPKEMDCMLDSFECYIVKEQKNRKKVLAWLNND